MKKIAKTFNGTGAEVKLCIGFIPDYVRIIALEDADIGMIEWYRSASALEVARGIHNVGSSGAVQQDARTVSDGGIVVYRGGEILTSSMQTSTTYGEGVYLAAGGMTDLKADTSKGGVSVITDWNLDTSANRTGHFNADVLSLAGSGRIGEGSKIVIRETTTNKVIETFIHTAGNGSGNAGGGADEVTLNESVKSGSVLYLGGMYDLEPLAVGSMTPAGVTLEMTSIVNVNDEMQLIYAEQYD